MTGPIISSACWYLALLIFAHAGGLLGGTTSLMLAGFMQSLSMVSLSAILMRTSEPRFRGRVMGVRMLGIYGLPVGLLIAGALIVYGVAPAHAAAAVLVYHAIAFWVPGLGGAASLVSLRSQPDRGAQPAEPAPDDDDAHQSASESARSSNVVARAGAAMRRRSAVSATTCDARGSKWIFCGAP